MRRTIAPVFAILATFALAGCGAAGPEATPTPSATANASEAPCQSFSTLTDELADLVVNRWTGNAKDGEGERLQHIPDDFDLLALKTDGPVGERMAKVADLLQDTSPIVMSMKPGDYFDAIKAVQRACAAESVTIGVATWS